MSSSKAPKTPDYTGAAIAQGQADKDIAQYLTQANRVNQVDPYGQTTWTQAADPAADAAKKEMEYWQNFVSGGPITDGRQRRPEDVAWAQSHQLAESTAKYNNLKGNGQWTQTTTLTPDQQKLLNQQQFIGQMQNDRIAGLIRDTKNPTAPTLGPERTLQQYGLSPERQLQERQLQMAQMSPERQLQATQLAPDRQLQLAQMSPQRRLEIAQMSPERQLEIAQMGPERALEKRELEQRQLADQRQLKEADRNDIQDLLYKQITKQYGSRFAQEEAAQRAQLANQGFQSGSEGFSNQLTDFNREKNSAYEDAAVSAALASYDQTNKDRALNQSEYGLLSSDDLNRYNAQTTNDLNRFNSLSSNDLNQWNAQTSNDLNRFNSQQSANLNNYNALTSSDLNRFNSQQSANLGNYTAQSADDLNRYNSQNNVNLNAFNSLTANDLNRYNSQSTQNRGNFDSQNANDLNRFQAQTTANLGNFGAQTAYDLDRYNSQSTNDLARFGALNSNALNQYSAQTTNDLNRYNAQLGQYNTDQNFLAQLLGGVAGPTNPQYQPYAQATPYQSPDLLGAMQGQYQGNLNRTNARNASNSQNMQTAGTIAAAAATVF